MCLVGNAAVGYIESRTEMKVGTDYEMSALEVLRDTAVPLLREY